MADVRLASINASAVFSELNGRAPTIRFNKGQVLFAQGDPCDSVFYVQEGKVKVTVLSKLGKEAVIGIHSVGDFVGEGCLTNQIVRMASAEAMTDCVVTRMAKAEVVRAMHDNHEFSELLMTHLLERNVRVEADLVDQLFNSAEKRLARLLLLLANFGKQGKPEPIIAPISQETLAEMIGTTRSRVNHFMNKFRRLGLISYNGHMEIHSSLLNVVLHEIPHIDGTSDDGTTP